MILDFNGSKSEDMKEIYRDFKLLNMDSLLGEVLCYRCIEAIFLSRKSTKKQQQQRNIFFPFPVTSLPPTYNPGKHFKRKSRGQPQPSLSPLDASPFYSLREPVSSKKRTARGAVP